MNIDASAYGDHSNNAEGQPHGGRVKINIGGSVFEASLSTLKRFDDSMFSALVANRWQQDELFIDRNPTHFGKNVFRGRPSSTIYLGLLRFASPNGVQIIRKNSTIHPKDHPA
ncbi:unnamed protein product [Cylicocyclus nassatus]|uniref:Potassium channel tetramerisation-type BTB domain-containing protein n=1 Tax=Cylicocyclus nassatus TaxID=53992 RepID=A0AA36MEK5_CYLNA|nr:unnamed protein product [Cylicocyclus nassatus]